MAVPSFLEGLFRNYDPQSIDVEKHAEMIIKAVSLQRSTLPITACRRPRCLKECQLAGHTGRVFRPSDRINSLYGRLKTPYKGGFSPASSHNYLFPALFRKYLRKKPCPQSTPNHRLRLAPMYLSDNTLRALRSRKIFSERKPSISLRPNSTA